VKLDNQTLTVIDALLAEEIPFLVVGSYSSNVYGVPRSTEDADLVIELGDKPLQSLSVHLPPTLHLDPQLRFESATGTTRNVITIDGSAFTVELFRLSTDPHDQERFRRRIEREVEGRKVYIPTAEDVVITKLRWASQLARGKDIDDIRNVLALQQEKLDWEYLHHWTAQHDTRALLDDVMKTVPSPNELAE
jgi:hypothetical protein